MHGNLLFLSFIYISNEFGLNKAVIQVAIIFRHTTNYVIKGWLTSTSSNDISGLLKFTWLMPPISMTHCTTIEYLKIVISILKCTLYNITYIPMYLGLKTPRTACSQSRVCSQATPCFVIRYYEFLFNLIFYVTWLNTIEIVETVWLKFKVQNTCTPKRPTCWRVCATQLHIYVVAITPRATIGWAWAFTSPYTIYKTTTTTWASTCRYSRPTSPASVHCKPHLESFEPRQANLCLRAFRHDKF